MPLNLTKPLVFFDLETTGMNIITDRIVEIALIKLLADQTKDELIMRINPGMPIPKEVSAIHGITDEDVKDCPLFKDVAHQLLTFIGNADLAGYNSNKFDVPFLAEEFARAGVTFTLQNRKLVDVKNIFYKMEPRTLGAAYKFYCKKELVNAHSALADTQATLDILLSQIEYYKEVAVEDKNGVVSYPVTNSVEELAAFSSMQDTADIIGHIIFNKDRVELFNFGKYKGQSVEAVFNKEPQYYNWMMNADFPASTKQVITAIYLRKLNKGDATVQKA